MDRAFSPVSLSSRHSPTACICPFGFRLGWTHCLNDPDRHGARPSARSATDSLGATRTHPPEHAARWCRPIAVPWSGCRPRTFLSARQALLRSRLVRAALLGLLVGFAARRSASSSVSEEKFAVSRPTTAVANATTKAHMILLVESILAFCESILAARMEMMAWPAMVRIHWVAASARYWLTCAFRQASKIGLLSRAGSWILSVPPTHSLAFRFGAAVSASIRDASQGTATDRFSPCCTCRRLGRRPRRRTRRCEAPDRWWGVLGPPGDAETKGLLREAGKDCPGVRYRGRKVLEPWVR